MPIRGSTPRVIERALEIEFFEAIGEYRIIGCVDDALILEKIEIAPLRDHFRNFRIISQSGNFRMLAQLVYPWECEKFLRAFGIGKYVSDFPEQLISFRGNGVRSRNRVSDSPKLERILQSRQRCRQRRFFFPRW